MMRRLPGSSVATATDAQIARSSGAASTGADGVDPDGRPPEGRDGGGPPRRRHPGPDLPAGSAAVRLGPLVVYFHGGGFVFGDLRGGDWIAGTVAKQLDAVVVSVDYRLAPKHPFPAAVDDCFAGLVWAAEHAAELGADAGRIGVMGESAGGNLAAVVALTGAGRVVTRPFVTRRCSTRRPASEDSESRRENADAVILTAADMQRFDELYAGDRSDWRVSPIRAATFAGLPPALIVVAGHDPLHDDGVHYAEALEPPACRSDSSSTRRCRTASSTSRGSPATRAPR